jgi:hypothetical protein
MTFRTGYFNGSDDMSPPKIERVKINGEFYWKVSAMGMEMLHRQDWQAVWQYEQACRYYGKATEQAENSDR